MEKEKVLLFGTGTGAKKTMSVIDSDTDVIGFIDNNRCKMGTTFFNRQVYSPHEVDKISYDKIVICSVAFDEIKDQLLHMGILSEKIVDKYYFHRKKFIKRYSESEQYKNNSEIQDIVAYVKKNGLEVFNYPFAEKYKTQKVNVEYDEEKKLYFIKFKNKKMYMSKQYDTIERVQTYVRGIMVEQDIESPHRYITNDFHPCNGDVVVDVGVAEGNFALDIIDNVSMIYLFEVDKDWIEALKYTFEPYKNKVHIIEGLVGDKNENGTISLDYVLENINIDFIKMDIEGAEVNALKGTMKLLRENNMKLDICAYHNLEDEQGIVEILKKCGYNTAHSDGYMVFNIGETFQLENSTTLVRGLVRGWK